MTTNSPSPVVFVGPSCPAQTVRGLLPNAVVAPPVGRGDLYRYRLLNFTHFVILDGVFMNAPAVSPREVVDVLEDGAVVIGASSMGALRAADCEPAGAIGFGKIFRLFRRRVLSSEDEVAVAFRLDEPYPALTEPLANIRIALHHAVRHRVLSRAGAVAFFNVAHALPFDRRSLRTIAKLSDVNLDADQLGYLASHDTKLTDAIGCCRWVMKRLADGDLAAASRRNPPNVLGSLGDMRERSADVLDGKKKSSILPGFVTWLAVSNQASIVEELDPIAVVDAATSNNIEKMTAQFDVEELSPEIEALLMQYNAFRRAVGQAVRLKLPVTPYNLDYGEAKILHNHACPTWSHLVKRHETRPYFCQLLRQHRDDLAMVHHLKNNVLFPSDKSSGKTKLLTWERT